MKNIVFVINTLEVGGAAKMLKYVANIACNVFDTVHIISLFDSECSSSNLNNKIRIKCLDLGSISRLKRKYLLIYRLRENLKELRPSFICSFVGHVNVISRLASLGLKNITFMSAERGDPYTQSFFWKLLTRWAYKNSDYCFFQLDNARDFFGNSIGNKSFVIPNPYIPNANVSPFWGLRKKTIVSAGRFSQEKCYDDLIEAFSIVKKKHPEYTLTIYGDGPMLAQYKDHVHKLNLSDTVSFPGYVSCVAEKIREDGIFVLSSLYEGIPNSLIEAMSVGIPCVSTDCTPGGPAFLFNNSERGLLVPVLSPKKMSDAILKYIENQDLASQKGRMAVEVLEDLNEERIRNMWLQAFNQIIECHERS